MYPCRHPIKSMLVLSLMLSSCIYDYDNCPSTLMITVDNDWSQTINADPEGMACLFFADGGGEPWRFDFPGKDGGRVGMPLGLYSVLSFNDDTYNVRFREDDGYRGYTAYTDGDEHVAFAAVEGMPCVKMPRYMPVEGQRLVKCPDMMWGCAYDRVIIEYGGIAYSKDSISRLYYSKDYKLTLEQTQLTARYSFIIDDVENLDGVKAMGVTFSGLAGALNLATGGKENYPVTVRSDAHKNGDTVIEGEFVTFGIPVTPDADNKLTLLVLLADNRKFSYTFDVTGQVREADDPLDVKVVIHGLRIEKSEYVDNPGAFEVGVDGWISVTININS